MWRQKATRSVELWIFVARFPIFPRYPHDMSLNWTRIATGIQVTTQYVRIASWKRHTNWTDGPTPPRPLVIIKKPMYAPECVCVCSMSPIPSNNSADGLHFRAYVTTLFAVHHSILRTVSLFAAQPVVKGLIHFVWMLVLNHTHTCSPTWWGIQSTNSAERESSWTILWKLSKRVCLCARCVDAHQSERRPGWGRRPTKTN